MSMEAEKESPLREAKDIARERADALRERDAGAVPEEVPAGPARAPEPERAAEPAPDAKARPETGPDARTYEPETEAPRGIYERLKGWVRERRAERKDERELWENDQELKKLAEKE